MRIGSSGISWKALEGGKTINVPASELKWVEWTRVARQFQLRVGLKDSWRREAFDGFTRQVKMTRVHTVYVLILMNIGPRLGGSANQAAFRFKHGGQGTLVERLELGCYGFQR